jgi:coenzyme F420-dependent glucose-6-phosphate dehydrogenase
LERKLFQHLTRTSETESKGRTTRKGISLGYFVELEKYPDPRVLIKEAQHAEVGGFDALWVSDHFHPWIHTDAGCSFTWVFLSALADNTRNIRIGTAVTSPILRYHPAIVAQAFATLGVMYPGRIFLSVGTGEAMNELPLGYRWPPFRERAARVEEAIKIILNLWTGQFCTVSGKYHSLNNAKLYTFPENHVPLYVAANGATVGEIAGKYSDGVLTQEFSDRNRYTDVLFPSVERGAVSAGRDPRCVERAIELNLSYDEDYDKALEACRRWSTIMVPEFYKKPISDPRVIESRANEVNLKDIGKLWLVGPSIDDDHIRKIEEYIKLGFTNLHFCSWSPSEDKFIEVYSKEVLPYLREKYRDLI